MKTTVALTLFAFASAANAIQGQWQGKYWYVESGQPFGSNYTDGNCLMADGTWYSTTIAGLAGHWYQKGDQLYINAVHPQSSTVFSSQLDKVSNKLFAGQHQHWAMDGSDSTMLYLKETFTFKSSVCDPQVY